MKHQKVSIKDKTLVFVVSRDWQVLRNLGLLYVLKVPAEKALFISEENLTDGNATKILKEKKLNYFCIPKVTGLVTNIWSQKNAIDIVDANAQRITDYLITYIKSQVPSNYDFVFVQDGRGPYLIDPMERVYYGVFREMLPQFTLFLQHGHESFQLSFAIMRMAQNVRFNLSSPSAKIQNKIKSLMWSYDKKSLVYSALITLRIAGRRVIGNLGSLKYLNPPYKQFLNEKNRPIDLGNRSIKNIVIVSPGVLRWSRDIEAKREFSEFFYWIAEQIPKNLEIQFKPKPGEEIYVREILEQVSSRVEVLDSGVEISSLSNPNSLFLVPSNSNTVVDLMILKNFCMTYTWTKIEGYSGKFDYGKFLVLANIRFQGIKTSQRQFNLKQAELLSEQGWDRTRSWIISEISKVEEMLSRLDLF